MSGSPFPSPARPTSPSHRLPSRVNDAVQIAPYLTHIVRHHGQLTLIPPQNSGRIRKAKGKRRARDEGTLGVRHANESLTDLSDSASRSPARRSRSRPQLQARPSSSALHADRPALSSDVRRHSAFDILAPRSWDSGPSRRPVSLTIPDFPPPTFEEAISSSSPSHVNGPISPTLQAESTTTIVASSSSRHSNTQPNPEEHESDSDSTSSSFAIVDHPNGSNARAVQWEEDRKAGQFTLEERVRREFERRRRQEASKIAVTIEESSDRHTNSDVATSSGANVAESVPRLVVSRTSSTGTTTPLSDVSCAPRKLRKWKGKEKEKAGDDDVESSKGWILVRPRVKSTDNMLAGPSTSHCRRQTISDASDEASNNTLGQDTKIDVSLPHRLKDARDDPSLVGPTLDKELPELPITGGSGDLFASMHTDIISILPSSPCPSQISSITSSSISPIPRQQSGQCISLKFPPTTTCITSQPYLSNNVVDTPRLETDDLRIQTKSIPPCISSPSPPVSPDSRSAITISIPSNDENTKEVRDSHTSPLFSFEPEPDTPQLTVSSSLAAFASTEAPFSPATHAPYSTTSSPRPDSAISTLPVQLPSDSIDGSETAIPNQPTAPTPQHTLSLFLTHRPLPLPPPVLPRVRRPPPVPPNLSSCPSSFSRGSSSGGSPKESPPKPKRKPPPPPPRLRQKSPTQAFSSREVAHEQEGQSQTYNIPSASDSLSQPAGTIGELINLSDDDVLVSAGITVDSKQFEQKARLDDPPLAMPVNSPTLAERDERHRHSPTAIVDTSLDTIPHSLTPPVVIQGRESFDQVAVQSFGRDRTSQGSPLDLDATRPLVTAEVAVEEAVRDNVSTIHSTTVSADDPPSTFPPSFPSTSDVEDRRQQSSSLDARDETTPSATIADLQIPGHHEDNNPESPDDTTTSPQGRRPPPDPSDFVYTDLDLLVARLDDNRVEDGLAYNDLLALSEIMGPGGSEVVPPPLDADIPVGRVEVNRRRVTKDGRVKLKLSLFGVVVDKCTICLTQFKENDWACLLPCQHVFHEKCCRRWLLRSESCPLCRSPIQPDQ